MSDNRQLLKAGTPVIDRSHTEIDSATGMQKDYIVLSAEERAKGFVKPVRRSYIHDPCGTLTTMGITLAETSARDPYFYSGTFCVGCKAHFDLSQFHWKDGEPMDPLLQADWNVQREAQEKRRKEEYRTRRIAELKRELTDLEAQQ
jgi:hypothetical protein